MSERDNAFGKRQSSNTHLKIQLANLRGSTLELLADQAAALALELVEEAEGASVTQLEGDNIVYIAGVGDATSIIGRRSSLVNSFTGRVIAGGRGQIFDPSSTSRSTEASRQRALQDIVRSGIIVPIVSGGIVEGTLGVISRTHQAFDANHLEIVSLIALAIGQRIKHGRDSAELERSNRRARFHALAMDSERHSADMSQIRASVDRLRSRVEASRRADPKPSRSRVDVERELHQAIAYTELTIREVASFEVRIEDDLPSPSGLLPGALWQAVMNLLRNAIQATPPGAPDQHHISLAASRHGARILITIQDSGLGMDAATLKHATEPFFSTRNATGMGLTIVHQTAEAAGGDLQLTSTPDHGCTATLSLPIETP